MEDEDGTVLPPPDITRVALGHLIRILARREPEILEEWVASLESREVATNIARLRPAPDQQAVEKAVKGAAAWAAHVRLIWYAEVGMKRARRRK